MAVACTRIPACQTRCVNKEALCCSYYSPLICLGAFPCCIVTAAERSAHGPQETGVKRPVALPPFIICPDAAWYRAFWFLTIAGAAWTGVIKPYTIAFEPKPGAK